MAPDHSSLLTKLYTSALFDGGLTSVLSDLASCYPDLPISYQAQCVYENKFYDCAIFNHGRDAERRLRTCSSRNPFPPIALKCDVSDVVFTGDHISPEDIEKLDFFDEFLKDHREINRAFGVILHRQGDDSAFVAANLPRTMAEREEEHVRQLFGFLRPHLQGAFGLLLETAKRQTEPANPAFWLDQIPTSALIVAPDGKVKHLNRQAERKLSGRSLLQIDKMVRLTACTPHGRAALTHALDKAAQTALPVGPVPLSDKNRGGAFVFVLPLDKRDRIHPGLAPFIVPGLPLLVTWFDPEDAPAQSSKILSTAFGLTGREGLLVQELILGSSLKEAAENLDISYNTARNHLANITSKTGSRSQGDVIRRGSQILARLGEGTSRL